MYVIQPIAAALLAGTAHWMTGGRKDHLRHKTDKMVIIGSVLAIWFVVYFMSGIVTTYARNTLMVDVKSVFLNIVGFAVVAVLLEYVRYAVLLLGGRRNVVWLGVIVTGVFALQQMSLYQLAYVTTLQEFVQLAIKDFVPAIATSLLLTYIAFTCGYGSQLIFRLGLVATVILPPILPKYDWYLTGMALLLLVIFTYVALDRSRPDRERQERRTAKRHTKIAWDIMFGVAMVGLIAFMTGVFSYKPTVIMSNSMNPVFYRGDMVVVQKRRPVDIQMGDILQYEVPGKTVTHRVVNIDKATDNSGERMFITKGDNNSNIDSMPVRENQVTGVVKARLPYIGYPTVWLKSLKT